VSRQLLDGLVQVAQLVRKTCAASKHLAEHAEPPIGSRRRSHAHRSAVAMAGDMIERGLGAVPLSTTPYMI